MYTLSRQKGLPRVGSFSVTRHYLVWRAAAPAQSRQEARASTGVGRAWTVEALPSMAEAAVPLACRPVVPLPFLDL